MSTIATYEVQVADLLHDPNNLVWSTTQLDRYINEARRQLVMDTGCLRSLQTAYFTQGVEAYTFGQVTGAAITAGGTGYTGTPTVAFSGGGGTGVAATLTASGGAVTSITFTNLGSGYTSPPTAVVSGTGSNATISVGALNINTYDVLDVHIIYGSTRYATQWYPWSRFCRIFRSNTTVQQRPAAWATYGLQQIYLGPLPDQTYQSDVDTIILPTDISGSTVDPIPPMVQDPIKFYSAYLAKYNAQQFGEAESFLGQYRRRLTEVAQAYTRRMGNVVFQSL